MRLLTGAYLAIAGLTHAQTGNLALKIPPVKTSLNLGGQAIGITVWGTASAASAGIFQLAVTVDLGDFQENLTPILGAELNRSDRCGERLSVERAMIAPETPSGVLTANLHYERFACTKAFGKEIVKRLVGGNGVVEVNLTPSIVENGITLTAQVRKVEADGSLGELLRSGSLGDSLRKKIGASIESAIQKAANLKSTLPAQVESSAALRTIQFADGGAGRLWLMIAGRVRLSEDQWRGLAKELAH